MLGKIEGEKVLERKLSKKVSEVGGICLKLPTIHFSGLPDRICLFPGSKIVFVEVKTTGQKLRKIQKHFHDKLSFLGFKPIIIESTIDIERLINEYGRK